MGEQEPKSVSRRTILKSAAASVPVLTGVASAIASPAEKVLSAQTEELDFFLIGPSDEMVSLFEDDLIPSFESAESVTVNLQTSDWGSAFQKITTAVASGLTPDVMNIGGIWTGPLASKDALLDLDEYVANWADREQFHEAFLEDGRYEGRQYALPFGSDTRTVIYRADFVDEAEQDASSPPTTWEEYKNLAASLVVKDGDQITREGASWGLDTSIGLQQAFAQLLFQAGGSYYKDDGTANFSSDEGVQALEYLVSFYAEGISSVNFVQQPGQAPAVVAGTAAMALSNSLVFNFAQRQAADVLPHLEASTPLRVVEGAEPVTSAWINKYAIGANTEAPDAAWKWLSHMLSLDALEKQLSLYGGLPPREDLSDAEYLQGIDEDFLDAAKYVVTQPPHPEMLQIAQIINRELERAIRLEATPESTLSTIDDEINSLTGA